jgi:hypothetical protein
MRTQELLEYLNISFSFCERPTPLQPQLRVIWGLSILVLILEVCSRSKRSSISRLHLLNWGIRNNENRERIVELLENRLSPSAILIQYEPGFNKAIDYALAEELIKSETNGRVSLMQNGQKLAKEIISLDDCLEEEKKFLRSKGSVITEKLAKILFKQSEF